MGSLCGANSTPQTTYAAGVLRVGDSAGLVHPFTGEGISFRFGKRYVRCSTCSESTCSWRCVSKGASSVGGTRPTLQAHASSRESGPRLFHWPWAAQMLSSAWTTINVARNTIELITFSSNRAPNRYYLEVASQYPPRAGTRPAPSCHASVPCRRACQRAPTHQPTPPRPVSIEGPPVLPSSPVFRASRNASAIVVTCFCIIRFAPGCTLPPK